MGCSYVFRLPDYLEGDAGEHVLIEYDVTWVCAGVDYALEQSQGFLCWVAKAFRVLSFWRV